MARHASARRVPVGRPLVALVALAGAAATTVALLPGDTSAAYTDHANVNTSTTGIGSSDPFDIGLVQDGTFRQAEGDGVAWELDADQLIPGTTVEAVIPVTNNGDYPADVSLRVEDLHDEATTGRPDPIGLYRWTVADATTGEVLAGSADPIDSTIGADALADALAPLHLEARGARPVADGAAWTPGTDGSVRDLRVTIAYPDTPESEAYNGGSSRLRIVFAAQSS